MIIIIEFTYQKAKKKNQKLLTGNWLEPTSLQTGFSERKKQLKIISKKYGAPTK